MFDNSTRANKAAFAIRRHSQSTGAITEPLETQARDLVGNIWHFLRLECGMSAEGATAQIEMALEMARQEYSEDKN